MPWLTYNWLHKGTYLDKIGLKYLSEIAASCRLSFPPKIRQIAVCSQQSLQAARCVQFRLGYIIDNSEKSLFNHQIQRTPRSFQTQGDVVCRTYMVFKQSPHKVPLPESRKRCQRYQATVEIRDGHAVSILHKAYRVTSSVPILLVALLMLAQ